MNNAMLKEFTSTTISYMYHTTRISYQFELCNVLYLAAGSSEIVQTWYNMITNIAVCKVEYQLFK